MERRILKKKRKCRKLTIKHKLKISLAHKGKKRPPLSEEWRRKISEANKGEKGVNWKGGNIMILCKTCGKEKWVKPSVIKYGWGKFCSLRCKSISNMIHMNKKYTDIEKLIETELVKRNISFAPHFPMLGITIVDFFIEPNIVIYCDGDYWHSSHKQKEKDLKQNLILESNGYKVFRFTGKEIKKSVEKCVDKITNWEDNTIEIKRLDKNS